MTSDLKHKDNTADCSQEHVTESTEYYESKEEIRKKFRTSLLNIMGLTEEDVASCDDKQYDFKAVPPKFSSHKLQQVFREAGDDNDEIIMTKVLEECKATKNASEKMFRINLSQRLTKLHEHGKGVRIKFVMLQFKVSQPPSKFIVFRISSNKRKEKALEKLTPVGIIKDEFGYSDIVYLDKKMPYYDRPDSMKQIHKEARYLIFNDKNNTIITSLCEIHYSLYKLEKRQKRDVEKCSSDSICCRTSLQIYTTEIGLDRLIYSPTYFDIGKCVGNCPYESRSWRSPNSSLSLSELVYKQGQCCCVTELAKVKLVYYLRNEIFVTEAEIGAAKCGCVGRLYFER